MPDPITSPPDIEAQKKALDAVLAKRLADLSLSRFVHLPPASESVNVSLGLAIADSPPSEDVARMFQEYFALGAPPASALLPAKGLSECLRSSHLPVWSPCFTLSGRRGSVLGQSTSLQGLFTADVLWLFFMERMGIFEMQGALIEDFAVKGKLAIHNHSMMAYLLEALTRDTVGGQSTSTRQRQAMYARTMGWGSKRGRELGVDATPNTAWNELFHKLLFLSLEYYKDIRLAYAIRGAAASASASVATFTTLRDTMRLLQSANDPFQYGRVAASAVSGIVGALGSFALVRDLRGSLGVPGTFARIDQYVPAAWELLVAGKTGNASGVNRYTVHRECATYGRTILLQLEVLDLDNRAEVELWLALIEDQVEGYRTAYRTMTGIDLGASASVVAEQAL